VIVPAPLSSVEKSGVPVRSDLGYAVIVPVIVNLVVKVWNVDPSPFACGAPSVFAVMIREPITHVC